MTDKTPCVYMMASLCRVLYIGVTSNLGTRVWQHRNRTNPNSFASRYHCTRLVWYEEFSRMDDAIAFEKALKGKVRRKKIDLIQRDNPDWQDLSESWEI